MIVFFCNNEQEQKNLTKRMKRTQKDDEILYLSTNYSYYKKLCADGYKVEYIEGRKQGLVEEATSILKQINKELFASLDNAYLFLMDYHIEGPSVGQEIVNFLCNYEECVYIFDKFRFDRIYMFANEYNKYECELMYEFSD